jgi:hypothetical protein
VGKALSMPGEGRMFATAGAGASLSFADGDEFLVAASAEPFALAVGAGTSPAADGEETPLIADGGEPLALAVRGGTPSVTGGGETFLIADGGEPLAVAVRGGASSVVGGGEARMTGGGYIGTSGPEGVEPLAEGRGDETPELAGLLHPRLRPPGHAAAVGERWSATDGGGAIESGRPTALWDRASPCSQKLAKKKPTANGTALLNRILLSASLLPEGYSASRHKAVSLSSQ